MSTFLFDKIIFGPVKSRRFGTSLGINLLPANKKVCSFNCIYCECGWSLCGYDDTSGFPSRQDLATKLSDVLRAMHHRGQLPDNITFAGNGEPTLHPEFKQILEDTIEIRNQFAPSAKVTVLSNSTTCHKPDVFQGLMLADNRVMKLDAGTNPMYRLINKGPQMLTLEGIVENLLRFEGHLTIQTLFLKGVIDGVEVDNTTQEEIRHWLVHLAKIQPERLMIYPIARETPAEGIEVIPKKTLQLIAKQVEGLGIITEVF
jgi:wyosine [tRNA(Phe)-imidazoG37] synthetase (radical SAM superfamily)